MEFIPSLDGVSDHCAVCRKKVQLWNIGKGPAANGMLILDPDTQESKRIISIVRRSRGGGGSPST